MTEVKVIVDEALGRRGVSFLTAAVVKDGKEVDRVAVPRDSTPEQISETLKEDALDTDSQEIRDVLNQAAEVVPGLEKSSTGH
jgi:hypothetical protein